MSLATDLSIQEELAPDEAESSSEPSRRSLLQSVKGGTEFIEKLIMIGLFAFIVAVGINALADAVDSKLDDQAGTIEGVNSGI